MVHITIKTNIMSIVVVVVVVVVMMETGYFVFAKGLQFTRYAMFIRARMHGYRFVCEQIIVPLRIQIYTRMYA
jgi:hypothetical protein